MFRSNTTDKKAAVRGHGKSLWIIFAVCLLAALFVMAGTMIFADNYDPGISGLTVVAGGDASWSFASGKLTGTVSALVEQGCAGEKFTPQTGTYTFTNATAEERVLGFDYNLELNGGTVSVDGTSVTSPGTFNKVMQANEDVVISITSNAVDHKSTSIVISNIIFNPVGNVTVTFRPAVNGSYTVNGETITADTVKTFSNTETVALSATASSGYKIFGWKNETAGDYFSVFASLSKTFYDSITVCPEFIENASPVFKAGNQLFADLNDAVDFAVADGHDVVTLVSSGTLPAGNYTVPAGVTLLLPMDDSFNVVRGVPNIVYGSHSNPTAFRMLTMADGANLTVAGDLSVAGKLSATGQMGGWNGTPTGPAGRISMNEGSSITLENGSNLYCWGYIYGSGSVVAEAGSTVYEAFQIKDWRGGTASSDVIDYAFLFSQYYIQNVEVPLTIYSGASVMLYSSVNASSAAYPTGAGFIGTSGCLFNISSGYIVKDYIEASDRLQVDVYGDISVSPMTLTGLPMIESISTADTILPITSNLSIYIHSGTTSIAQNIELLPGVEFCVDSGAEVDVAEGKNVYAYDNDDWLNFTGNARFYVIGYSVANGTTTKRTAASLVDALIDVNGTLNVSGGLYTSLGGANITSSEGTGKVVFSSAVASEDATIYEMLNNSTQTEVTFNPARLHNGPDRADGIDEYTATLGSAAGTTFKYCKTCDIWDDSHTHTITWVINGEAETEEIEIGTVPTHETPVKASDSQFAYNFAAWFPTPVEVTGDATYTAEFAGYEIAPATDDANLKLNARTLYLYNDLSIVYKINASTITAGGFTDPYLICTINNRAVRVNGTLKTDEDHVDKYFFEFKNVNPQQMSTSVYTYVYATKNGALTRGTAMTTYSVRKYAENQLAKATTPAVLRTLLVDLLNYGTAAQVYSNHRTVDLANSTLTAEQLAYGSTELPELVSVSGQGPEIDSPSVAWKGVTLMLDKAVQIRLEIECADISGLKASVVTDYGRTYEITSDKLVPVGSSSPSRYYVFLNEVNFARLRSRYDVTFLNASDEPVSRTYSYSAASYALKRFENPSTPENLLALVDRLMKFGASVEAYVATM